MWDQRYATPNYVYGKEPNHFLVDARERLADGGRVLCVADGEGRNGVWLARQGFDVLSTDISPNALAKARKLAESHGVRITTEAADLTDWDWPVAAFDAVVGIFIQPFGPQARQTLFDNIVAALKPGGASFCSKATAWNSLPMAPAGRGAPRTSIPKSFCAVN